MSKTAKLLVVSGDIGLGEVRKDVLEAAGFTVISANSFHHVEEACNHCEFWLAVLGHTIPTNQKRRVWAEIATRCPGTAILDLYDESGPVLLDAEYHLDAQLPLSVIAEKIKKILRGKGGPL